MMHASENQNNLMMDDMDGVVDDIHEGVHHMMDMDDEELHYN